jgi:cytochrome c553
MANAMKSVLGALFFFWLMATKAVLADGASIALSGNNRGAPACVTCHGASGAGGVANGFPRLPGLNAGYLQAQLDAFANGQRRNAMMTPITQILSPDERAALARYYSGLTISTDPSPPPNTETIGAQLALKGRWSDGLPACVQCHGATGAGVGRTFPALAGQSALYIENQLHAWQQGSRAPGPMGLMKLIASKLSAVEIKSVAAYFAAIQPEAAEKGRAP